MRALFSSAVTVVVVSASVIIVAGAVYPLPLEPSTKSLSNGSEILLFERGEPARVIKFPV